MKQHHLTTSTPTNIPLPPIPLLSPLSSTTTTFFPRLSKHGNSKVPPPPLLASSFPLPLLKRSRGQQVIKEAEEESALTMEARQALPYATLELEAARVAAQEEIARMEAQATHLKALLAAATTERDELRQQCHHARLLLLHPSTPHHHHHVIHRPNNADQAHVTSSQPPKVDENGGAAADASASSEESSIASSAKAKEPELDIGWLAAGRELPKRGRLLEAVMNAGPLLQNLLLAGPLPEWQHPPPPMGSFEIPPVSLGITPKLHNCEVTNNAKGTLRPSPSPSS